MTVADARQLADGTSPTDPGDPADPVGVGGPVEDVGDLGADGWVDVCDLAVLTRDRGVAALVGGRAVAVFRCSPADELYAVDNVDPFSGASVLSRGIVGSVGDRPTVASPVHKQRFDLRTGEHVDDPSVRLDIWGVREVGGRVQVSARPDRAVGG
jgi:nitrite reductase (NADH) small subunit